MKIETENKEQFILDRIDKIMIKFSDGCEIILDYILKFDFDLNRYDSSFIELTNCFIDQEIMNRFQKKISEIDFIHIEGRCITKTNAMTNVNSSNFMWNIPCLMDIRNIRLNGDSDSSTCMYIELEGVVS